jgi:ABC-type polysaccharide/polyol phosphate transport system ATPase subunit
MELSENTGSFYFICITETGENAVDKANVIKMEQVTVRFNLAKEKVDNLKEYVVRLMKHELLFQEFLALKDVSFEVKKGEAWALIGHNGAGKSTMLKLICGILKPYRGAVTVSGTISPLIELGAGFDMEMTARENIHLNGAVLGNSEKFIRSHFDEIVDFAEIRDFLDVPLKNFSSGMTARLGFAVATVVKPDILIVDEVLSVGDISFQKKCEQRMKQMRADGATLIYVSHSIESVKKLCQKAVWLERGMVRMQGDVHKVCSAYLQEGQEYEN